MRDSAYDSEHARLLDVEVFESGERMLSTGWKATALLIAFAFMARPRNTPVRTPQVHFSVPGIFPDLFQASPQVS